MGRTSGQEGRSFVDGMIKRLKRFSTLPITETTARRPFIKKKKKEKGPARFHNAFAEDLLAFVSARNKPPLIISHPLRGVTLGQPTWLR